MKKIKLVLLLISVCFAAIFLLNDLVFPKNHNIVVQHYDMSKNEYVFYKSVTNEKDIRNIHRFIQNADWEKYDPAKDDSVVCQFYFENGSDKAIVYQVINNHGEFILVQKDVEQKGSLVDKDLELIINILQ